MNNTTSNTLRAARMAALLGSASLAAIASCGLAYGQAASAQTAQNEVPEQVLITGSLIHGEAAIGVPVVQLGTIEFKQTGALTVSDLLRTVPAIAVEASTSIANAGGQINRAEGVDIHSLNSNTSPRTLMMINGGRFPAQGHGTDRYDPSIIPQLAVDHVDVLADGASATYGSDAIAGVINVVMKRGYDGAETQLRYGFAKDGANKYQAAQLWGRTWDGGDITLSYEWYDETALTGKARSMFTFNYSPWGLDDRTPISSVTPGVVSTGGANSSVTTGCTNCFSIPRGTGWNYGDTLSHTNPTASGSAPTINWTTLQANPGALQNEVNPYYFSDVTAAQQRNAATLTLDQRLFPNVEGFVDAFYQNRRVQQRYPVLVNPAKNQQNFRDAVPTFNPYYPAGAPSGLRINYNISAELQPTLAAAEMSGRWSAGLNLTLPSDWHGKLSYGYNLEENRALVSNVANLNNISAALGWTIPVTPASGTRPAIATWAKPANIPYLNVFCDPFAFQCNSPTTLNYISGYRDYDEHYGITEWNATFDGPLFSLPGGPVKAAVGADYQTHHFNFTVRQTYAPSSTLAAAMPEISVDPESRQNWAAFTEVNIPVIGEMNSLPLVHSLEVVGSFRYDHYSDFGGTRNPKVSVNWYPIEDLKLRGTWGTSFRAPAFSDSSAVGGVQIQPLNLAAGDSADVYPTCDTGQVLPTPGSAAEALAKALNPGSPTCASIPRFPGGLTVRGGAGGAALIRGGTTLEPEKATNWSGGFDYAPKGFFSGLDVSATYFWVKVGGLMQGLETSTGLGLRDPNTRSTFILPDNPNFANYVNALMSDPRSFVNPNFRTNILFINDGAIRNIGNLKVDGIDFNASYDWDWGQFGAWHAGIDGTYFLHRTQVSIPGTPATNFYDGNGIVCQFCNPASPDRFRYRVSLGWDSDPFMVNLFMNYQSHFYSNQAFPPASFLVNYPNYSDLQPNYITWDLSLGYNTGTKPANDYLQNVDFRFILSNLLDKKPPFMYKISSGGSNPAAFDINLSPVGRVMTFVITKTW